MGKLGTFLKNTPASSLLATGGAAIGVGQALAGTIGMENAKKQAFESIDKIQTYQANPEIAKYLQMRRQKLGTGLGSVATELGKQGIDSSAGQATSAALQMGRGAGLSALSAIQKNRQAGMNQLAGQANIAEKQNINEFGQAVAQAGNEREKQFRSEQEKQQLRSNIRLQQLAAKRAMVAQGLQGAIGSLASGASGSSSAT